MVRRSLGSQSQNPFVIILFCYCTTGTCCAPTQPMDLKDYLIPQAGKDWRTLLAGWLQVLPPSFTLWMVNRFGDLFVVLDDDSVHMLDVGVGSFKRLADSRSHFASLIGAGDNANHWLMI